MTRQEILAIAKPILYNTEMVRAILDGHKTATRRIIKPQPAMDASGMWHWRGCQWMDGGLGIPRSGIEDYTPYCPGDLLYVREAWQFIPCIDCRAYTHKGCVETPITYEDRDSVGEGCFIYRANYPEPERICWHPSIHMPKEAARLFLRVTGVRVERLQDIKNFRAEGIASESCDECFAVCGGCDPDNSPTGCDNEAEAFANLWDSTVKPADRDKFGWDVNPWIWVIEFERVVPDD